VGKIKDAPTRKGGLDEPAETRASALRNADAKADKVHFLPACFGSATIRTQKI
jgi:hypothetical protein